MRCAAFLWCTPSAKCSLTLVVRNDDARAVVLLCCLSLHRPCIEARPLHVNNLPDLPSSAATLLTPYPSSPPVRPPHRQARVLVQPRHLRPAQGLPHHAGFPPDTGVVRGGGVAVAYPAGKMCVWARVCRCSTSVLRNFPASFEPVRVSQVVVTWTPSTKALNLCLLLHTQRLPRCFCETSTDSL